MNCNDVRDNLAALIDGELREADARAIEAHLADCARCRAEYAIVERLISMAAKDSVTAASTVAAAVWSHVDRELLLQLVQEVETLRDEVRDLRGELRGRADHQEVSKVKAGVISQEQSRQACEVQKAAPGDLATIIHDLGFASEREIASARAASLGLQFVDLTRTPVEPEAVKSVPEHIAKRYNILPIRKDTASSPNKLMVAVGDIQSSMSGIDDVRLVSRCQITPVLAAKSDIEAAIARVYNSDEAPIPSLVAASGQKRKSIANPPAISGDQPASEDEFDVENMSAEAPIIRIAHAIVQEGIRQNASDVHVEPMQKGVRIRNRIDGVLEEVMTVPKNIQDALIARFKIMADMNVDVHNIPQEGRISIKTDGKDFDIRVFCCPTFYGEKIVMRVLDRSDAVIDFSKLGLSPDVRNKLEELASSPSGMILTAGPGGSGKTTTLYSIIDKINTANKNVATVEDPIERQIPGVSQIPVDRKAGVTFAGALRSLVKQAPDVVMVGEMRDLETCQAAVEASTERLVLSTLRTNDAPSTLMRLVDMGTEPYRIASTVIGILAQRLCRRICKNCKEPYEVPASELSRFGLVSKYPDQTITLYRGTGCNECRHRGYKGRVGLFELLTMNETIAELVVRGASVAGIREAAKQAGMMELREDGLVKILEGITTPDEVKRVVFIPEPAPSTPGD